MLLFELFTVKRLSGPSKKTEPETSNNEFDLDFGEPSDDEFDLDLDSPEGGEATDEPTGDDDFNFDTETAPEDTIGNDSPVSFSSFMGSSGGSSLGSASASTPQPGEAGTDSEDPMGLGGEEVEDPNVDQLASKATEDPDKQGLIRTVKGAHLVYKRETEDGTYEEMWAYNTKAQDYKEEQKRRQAILAGTDIPPNKTTSPDGSQSYEIWVTSNAEIMVIKGLTN